MDERWLRERVREVIRTGDLPDRPAGRVWGGPGSGLNCTLCGRALTREEPEIELEFFGSDPQAGPRAPHLHVACFKAWDLECRSSRAADTPEGLSAAADDGTITPGERLLTRTREEA